MELSVLDLGGNEVRVELPEVTGFCWHGYVPHLPPGTLYGFRVHGPYDPASGLIAQFGNVRVVEVVGQRHGPLVPGIPVAASCPRSC